MAVKTGLDGLVLARTTFCMTSSLEPCWTVVVAVEAEEMCIIYLQKREFVSDCVAR